MQQTTLIPTEEIKMLRNKDIITDSEIAYYYGDLVIAEDILSGTKRILEKSKTMILETNKRMILLG